MTFPLIKVYPWTIVSMHTNTRRREIDGESKQLK